MMFEREDRGSVAILTMTHGKANALNLAFLAAFESTLAELASEPIAGVVLTARGKIFSAGVDLAALAEGGAEYADLFLPAMSQFYRQLFTFPKPVVAAVNGHALAGGCLIASACDHRVMATGGGKIGLTELAVGVPFPAVPLELARFSVRPRHFTEIIYFAKGYLPDEALERGLVDELAAPEETLDRAVAIAQRLASVPAETFRLTKQSLRAPALERMDRYSRESDPAVIQFWRQPATMERVKQFLQQATRGK